MQKSIPKRKRKNIDRLQTHFVTLLCLTQHIKIKFIFVAVKPLTTINIRTYIHYHINMIYRKLGPTGIQVSVISYGNWVNSNSKEAQQLTYDCVKTAWDLGINFFDTAQSYGYGQAERQIGLALKALGVPRHHFVLSTKIFFASPTQIPTLRGLSRKHIIQGLRKSLKNLDYDHVDIVFCHRPDQSVPMEEICRAYDWIIRKGWAFYWGTSEWNQEQIAEAHHTCGKYSLIRPVVEQPQYNIFARENMEVKYRRLFEAGQLGTTIWSPLAGGVLTGKYNQGIPEGSRYDKNPDLIRIFKSYFSEETKEKTIKALSQFGDLAKELECTQAQLAMAWCISNPDVTTAITGATRVEQLVDTVKALEVLPKLTPQVQKRIEQIFESEPTPKTNFKLFAPQANRRREILKY